MTRYEHDTAESHPMMMDLAPGTYYWCQCGKTKNVPYCDGSHAGSGVEPLAFEIAEAGTYAICNCGLTTAPPFCSGAHADIK